MIRSLQKVAVGIDIRTGQALDEVNEVLDQLKSEGKNFEILFLDAEDSVLVKRYKETRRNHPLAGGERVDKGILLEREKLAFLKKRADYIIDTSQLLTRELKAEISKIFEQNQDYKNLFVTILSFGFKYGIPADSDLVFDVRFLPNPYYVEGLRYKNGNDKEIQDYVLQFEEAHDFLDKLEDMMNFLIPNYITEGKNQLVISVGCTGGKHRSVTLANELVQAAWQTRRSMGLRSSIATLKKMQCASRDRIMSFSGEVKDELAKHIRKSRHCQIAELAAIMGFDGRIEQKNGKTVLEITTENAPLARKCFTLIKKTFNISTDIDVRTGNGMGHNHIYVISTDKPDEIEKILAALKMTGTSGGTQGGLVNGLLIQNICCRAGIYPGSVSFRRFDE